MALEVHGIFEDSLQYRFNKILLNQNDYVTHLLLLCCLFILSIIYISHIFYCHYLRIS